MNANQKMNAKNIVECCECCKKFVENTETTTNYDDDIYCFECYDFIYLKCVCCEAEMELDAEWDYEMRNEEYYCNDCAIEYDAEMESNCKEIIKILETINYRSKDGKKKIDKIIKILKK